MKKFLIHNGEQYYPSAEVFDKFEDAVKAFKKLKEDRIDAVKMNVECGSKPSDLLFEKDYLCIVIDEIDPVLLAEKIPHVPYE